MSISGIIRRGDRRPLGSLEQVKTRLNEAFPGTQFTFVSDSNVIQPSGFNLVRLLFWLFNPRCPHWEGSFEGGEFIAVFSIDSGPIVDTVEVTLYGRGTSSTTAHFARLAEKTGWQTEFPKF